MDSALAIKLNLFTDLIPFVKIWIHAVWTTKNRESLPVKAIRPKVFEQMQQNALNYQWL